MNIFLLDYDLTVNATYYINRHVVKQPLEAAQLLCTARQLVGDGGGKYDATHVYNSITRWLCQSTENYKWLCELSLQLCKEYTFRYDKTLACQKVIEDCELHPINRPGEFSYHPPAMPDDCKVDDIVESYRKYYITHKVYDKSGRFQAYWYYRNKPDWFVI